MTTVMPNDELVVVPGDQVTCTVQVRNTGSVVDEYSLEILGNAGPWATVEPSLLRLYPGTEGTATVRFAPPKDALVSAGGLPFGLKVASREDPTRTTVEEGVLNIAPFADAFAELVPRSARGRRSATYQIALDNRGNARINAPLSAFDPENALRFRLDPPTLVAEPGTAVFGKVTVTPRRTFWRGAAKTKTFQITAEPEGLEPLVADGSLLQDGLIPEKLPKMLMAALGLLALLALVWLVALKPYIKSIGKKAGDKAAQTAVTSPKTQSAIKDAATKAAKDAVGPGPYPGPDGLTALRGAPVSNRLAGTQSFTVPAHKLLQITDIVLENPNEDKGTLSVQRSGAVMLHVALENFRDLDYHFVAPIIFTAGQTLELVSNVDTCTGVCQPAIYYSGYLADA